MDTDKGLTAETGENDSPTLPDLVVTAGEFTLHLNRNTGDIQVYSAPRPVRTFPPTPANVANAEKLSADLSRDPFFYAWRIGGKWGRYSGDSDKPARYGIDRNAGLMRHKGDMSPREVRDTLRRMGFEEPTIAAVMSAGYIRYAVPDDTITAEIGTTGRDFTITLSGDPAADVATAIAAEHTESSDDSPHCDICLAAENGFPFSAAHLLQGATETPLLDAVIERYRAEMYPDGTPGVPADWGKWTEWFTANTWECAGCGAFTSNDSCTCGNCRVSRPTCTECGEPVESGGLCRVCAIEGLDKDTAELYATLAAVPIVPGLSLIEKEMLAYLEYVKDRVLPAIAG